MEGISKLKNMRLKEKVEFSKRIIKKALKDFKTIAVAITGGKDSTTVLWLVREVCREMGKDLPVCVFINEGDEFEEIIEFLEELKRTWHIEVRHVQNEDVLKNKSENNLVFVNSLNKKNRDFLKELNFDEPYFVFETESFLGTQLMKVLPLKVFLEEYKVEALITGVRWDEQEARKGEEFFSQRKDPDHIRIHPILHMTEKDIWDLIHLQKIPFCSLYRAGYRSLGARSSTEKVSDVPAWEQDLDNTSERAGRMQKKEGIMASLRELGYM